MIIVDIKVLKDKCINRSVVYLIYIRWNSIKNRAQRRRRWLIEGKDIAVENINKDAESFLEIGPVQKQVHLRLIKSGETLI